MQESKRPEVEDVTQIRWRIVYIRRRRRRQVEMVREDWHNTVVPVAGIGLHHLEIQSLVLKATHPPFSVLLDHSLGRNYLGLQVGHQSLHQGLDREYLVREEVSLHLLHLHREVKERLRRNELGIHLLAQDLIVETDRCHVLKNPTI